MRKVVASAVELGLPYVQGEIKPGDLYLAHKNANPFLLTCDRNEGSFIVPREFAYCYNVCDCVKIDDGVFRPTRAD